MNVFGALTLAVADQMFNRVDLEAPEAGNAAAALVLLAHVPGMSVEQLRSAIALSHPGAVRLVDRLAGQGLVERYRSDVDGRAVALHLTERGDRARRAVQAARAASLSRSFAALTPDESRILGGLAAKMLNALVSTEAEAYRVCRLCDHERCNKCPVDQAMIDQTPEPG